MKLNRNNCGVAVTVVWLCVFGYALTFVEQRPAKLNEWGDFLAGFFAPLAFLWLVLGYLQQGEELKHSTEALKLQALELKNSVEQQTELVAATREQIRIDLEKVAEGRALRRRAALPRFVATRMHSLGVPPNMQFFFEVKNLGIAATDVNVTYEGGGAPRSRYYSTFDHQTQFDETVVYSTDCEFVMKIEFEDGTGQRGIAEIPFKVGISKLEIGAAKMTAL